MLIRPSWPRRSRQGPGGWARPPGGPPPWRQKAAAPERPPCLWAGNAIQTTTTEARELGITEGPWARDFRLVRRRCSCQWAVPPDGFQTAWCAARSHSGVNVSVILIAAGRDEPLATLTVQTPGCSASSAGNRTTQRI